MGIAEDLNELEQKMKKLIFEYNQFVTGIEKKPPYELENRVSWLIKHYLHRKLGRAEYKHRFQNVVASYRTHKNMWERRLGYREKGLDHLGRDLPPPDSEVEKESSSSTDQKTGQAKTPSTKQTEKKKEITGVVFKATTRDPSKETQFIDKMYKTYIKAQKLTDNNIKTVRKEKFAKLIEKQVSQLKEKTKCDTVRFRIEMVDNKVKLKASAVKPTKK